MITSAPARIAWEWSTRLAARGHAITVLVGQADGDPPGREVARGVEIVRASLRADRGVRGIGALLWETGRLRRDLHRDRAFDVICALQPAMAGVLGGDLNPREASSGPARIYAPLSSGAGESSPEKRERLARSLYERAVSAMERRALRSAEGVIVPDRCAAEGVVAAERVSSDRVHLVPGGVDTERFRPSADRRLLRRQLGLRESAFLLFTSGPLTPGAGLDHLITAMAGVTARYPEAHLVIGGDGPLEAELRRQTAEQGLGDAITFAGYIPELLRPEYYALADLFVLPTSSAAPSGPAAVEALACGTPVLATPVGAHPEILSSLDPRALFAGTGAAAIADGIVRQLPELHHNDTMRRRCRQFAQEHYSWDVVISTLESALYESVARCRRALADAAVTRSSPPVSRRASHRLPPRPCTD